MIRSMTGFGAADRTTPAGLLRVELRTVNHRYLNINARLPSSLNQFEPELREWVRGWFTRGHVNCTIRLEADEESSARRQVRIDAAKAAGYLAALRELGDRFGLPGTPDLALLSRFSDLFVRDGETADDAAITADELRAALETAAEQALSMRDEEGARLQLDLEERLALIERALAAIAERAPQRLLAERDRLRDAVRELTAGLAVDEHRLAQEIAYLAERWDVNEEIVRFRSHLALFHELLVADAAVAVGKRLAFLVQEMHREANTIGAKANDAAIAHRVITVKEEVERLREQVENVE